jgi:hypothetical protein
MQKYISEVTGNEITSINEVRVGSNRQRVLVVGKPFTTQGSGKTGLVSQIDRRNGIKGLYSVRLVVDGVERWTTADFR